MDDLTRLSTSLSEIFSESVTIENVQAHEIEGLTLTVTDMTYRQVSQSDSGSQSTVVTQTVVHVHDEHLELPQFALHPTPKGIAGKLMSILGGMGDLNFDDSPEFSEAYHLQGWAEKPVRLLFTPEVREYFSKDATWSVQGKGKGLAIFQGGRVIDEQERDEFIPPSLEIVSLFQEAEETLDAHEGLRREASTTDMLNTAERMGGMVGAMLKKQLLKIRITRNEMDAFQRSSPPRTIPKGMAAQVVGNNLPLVFAGAAFFVVGVTFGTLMLALEEGKERFVGVPFLIVFPIVGFCMMFFTMRYRRRKQRTLQSGELVPATVMDVKSTSVVVNNQSRYTAAIALRGDESQQISCNLYGESVSKARQLQASGESMNVLIDPSEPTHVVCVDLLHVFD